MGSPISSLIPPFFTVGWEMLLTFSITAESNVYDHIHYLFRVILFPDIG